MISRAYVAAARPIGALLLLLLAACASTSLETTWKSPDWAGPPLRRLLVVGVSQQPTVRRAFEDGFAARLGERGVSAVASYTFVPEAAEIGREALERAVAQADADGVIVTSLVKRETRTEVTPGYTPGPPIDGYYGGYSVAWSMHYEPPTVVQYDVVTLETQLFAVDGARLVWSGTTETFSPRDVAAETRGFADVIIRNLRDQGLI
jgi:hypothetical protein